MEIAKLLEEAAIQLRRLTGNQPGQHTLEVLGMLDSDRVLMAINEGEGRWHIKKLALETGFSRPKVYKELEKLRAELLIVFQKHNLGGAGNKPSCTPKGERRIRKFLEYYSIKA